MARISKIETVQKSVTISIKCDVCGKIHIGDSLPNNWHNVTNRHHHWGNDSIDSYESHDVCSVDCYKEKIKQIVLDYDGFTDAQIDDFEIQFARLLVNYF